MYHFIVNNKGGSGKAHRRWCIVQNTLEKKQIEYKAYFIEYPHHGSVIIKEVLITFFNSLGEHFDNSNSNDKEIIKIVVVGGDGTTNEVLNGIYSFSVENKERVNKKDKEREDFWAFSYIKFGVIPTGSGNDYSRGLKLPRHNPYKALKRILNSSGDRVIDLGVASIYKEDKWQENKVFVISSGAGLDALICKKVDNAKIKVIFNKIHMGKISYAILTLLSFFTLKKEDIYLTIDGKRILLKDLIFISIMNFSKEGGGVPMNPMAKLNDGLFSVTVCSGVSKVLAFFYFPFLLLGVHKRLKCFEFHDTKTLEIEYNNDTVLHTDGEVIEGSNKTSYQCIKEVLSVLV